MAFVKTEVQGAVEIITIDRPKALNALNPEVLAVPNLPTKQMLRKRQKRRRLKFRKALRQFRMKCSVILI